MGGGKHHSGVSLQALLPEGEIVGAADLRVGHVSFDSRMCREGDLFAALRGRRVDGHAYVEEAIRMGAKAVLASQPLPGCPVPVCYVADTHAAYARLCQGLAGRPAEKLKTIGVAGTFGKTTTSYLIASALSAGGRLPGLLTSLGYCDGREISDARWTTPPAHVAAAWLARMVENERTHAVAEISGRGLRESRLAGVDLDCLCVTNWRGDEHSTSGAKTRLLEQLTPEGVLVVNVDDAECRDLCDRHDGPVVTIGIDQPAEISATVVERSRSEQTLLLSFGREVVPLRTTLHGRHNALNCLLAAAVGSVYGISPAEIIRGLEEVRELPGRLERIECGQPFGVFVDEGLAPDSLGVCLESLRETSEGRLICVFSSSPLHSRASRLRLAKAVQRWCDVAVLTSSPVAGDGREVGELTTAWSEASHCEIVLDRAEAVQRALRQARPGDCVLIAGQGNGTYRLADREQDYWDDRQVVREVLYSLPSAEAPRKRAA